VVVVVVVKKTTKNNKNIDYATSVTEECMSVEKWCKDTGTGKVNYAQKNLSWCHFVCNKCHMDWI
jgi:hypothetical protein